MSGGHPTGESDPSRVTFRDLMEFQEGMRAQADTFQQRLRDEARQDRAEILKAIADSKAETREEFRAVRSDLQALTNSVSAVSIDVAEMRGELKSLDARLDANFWKNTIVAAGLVLAFIGGVAGVVALFI